MKIIQIFDDGYGIVGYAKNYNAAIRFLLEQDWFTKDHLIYERMFGYNWREEISNLSIEEFNYRFEESLCLTEEEIYE